MQAPKTSPAREQQFKILLGLIQFKGSMIARDLAQLAYPSEFSMAEETTIRNVETMLDEMTELGMLTRIIKSNLSIGDLVYRVAGSPENKIPDSTEDTMGKKKAEKKKSAGPPKKRGRPKKTASKEARAAVEKAVGKAAKKKRQKDLKGINKSPHADLNELIKRYVKYRDARLAVLVDEVDAQEKLLASMKKHEETEYSYEGFVATIVHEDEKVKVKKQKINLPDDD